MHRSSPQHLKAAWHVHCLNRWNAPVRAHKETDMLTGYPVNAATILILQNLGNTPVGHALEPCMQVRQPWA
jgi:hypothetical protein